MFIAIVSSYIWQLVRIAHVTLVDAAQCYTTTNPLPRLCAYFSKMCKSIGVSLYVSEVVQQWFRGNKVHITKAETKRVVLVENNNVGH